MLRVIRRLKAETPLLIKSTFLGAHAVPLEYKGRQTEYVDLIINEMIPMVAAEELADYIDVFCDKGFFTVEDTDRMLNAAMQFLSTTWNVWEKKKSPVYWKAKLCRPYCPEPLFS